MSAERSGAERILALGALIWFGAGSLDYVLTHVQVGFYLRLFSADQLAFYTGLPAAAHAAWAVGVWAGLAGAMTFWFRGSGAILFGLSTAGLAGLTIWVLLLADPGLQDVTGPAGSFLMLAAVLVSAALAVWTARPRP
ncbi:MAG: hypothetical protein AAFR35_07350 [Pseudomonadota bacterium]